MRISPTQVSLTLSATAPEATSEVTLTNDSSSSVLVTIRFEDFSATALGTPQLGAAASRYSLKKWIRTSTPEFTLEPGASRKVDLRVTNEAELAPGGHYTALVVTQSSPEAAAGEKNVQLRDALVSSIFLVKEGGESPRLGVGDFVLEHSLFSLSSTQSVQLLNLGNTQVVPRGTVQIIDPLGNLVAKGTINNESSILLPESGRLYVSELNQIAEATVPGNYRTEVAFRYDGRDEYTIAYQSSFLLPLNIFLLISAAGVVVLLICIRMSVRYWKRR